jgi:hypothetical protein
LQRPANRWIAAKAVRCPLTEAEREERERRDGLANGQSPEELDATIGANAERLRGGG